MTYQIQYNHTKHNIAQTMESVGSNSPPATSDRPIVDRLVRALSHRLALLHRSDPTFYVLGATANVYAVTVSPTPTCTCPDRTSPCKHILFVLLRVLSLPLDDPCLLRRTLRPSDVPRLLSAPTASGCGAGARAVARFHEAYGGSSRSGENMRMRRRREGPEICPVCLEQMEEEEGIATCATCGNSVHGECLKRWRRSRGRRAATCVVCRARWRERGEVERYLNLAGYVGEEGEARGWGVCAR